MVRILKSFRSIYSKKTLILGTFQLHNNQVTYTVIEKDVVHKLFGFPVLKHAGMVTPDDLKHIIS